MTTDLQCVVFQLAHNRFAIDIRVVNEIIVRPEVTPVPQAPIWAEGIANLRGRVLAVVDLRKRLNLPADGHATHALVLTLGSETVGMLVEGVSEVLRVPADAMAPPPVEMQVAHDGLVQAVYQVHDEFVLIWDTTRLLGTSDRPGLLSATAVH